MGVRLILSLLRWGWWLFDIVGLDEGTCGRRRLLPGLQGSGWQFKIVVTLSCPYVTIRLDMCRVMIPELILRQMASLCSCCCEIGHKLESLILAQNERWRHA